MVNVNQELFDSSVRHSIYLQRYKTHEVKKILNFLNRLVLPDITRQMKSRLEAMELFGFDKGPFVTEQLNNLISSVKGTLAGGTRLAYQKLSKDLKELALSEGKWQTTMFNSLTPSSLNIQYSVPSPELLHSIVTHDPFEGRLLKDHFDRLPARTGRNLRNAVNVGIAAGENNKQIMRRVRQQLNVTRHQAATITRTAASHVSNNARFASYEANSDVIGGWQFVATLDTRTTDICMGLDGNTYKLDEGASDRPPVHHQCRSDSAPTTKTWEELGIKGLKEPPPLKDRAALGGPVSGRVTYGPWLKRQPKSVQVMALGKTKAQLFRSGKVDIKEFAYKDNNREWKSLPLKKLLAKEEKLSSSIGIKLREPTRFLSKADDINRLLKQLESATDPKVKKSIRAKLRQLGHKGGTKKPPIKPPPKPVKPKPTPKPKPKPKPKPPVATPDEEIQKLIKQLEETTDKKEKARIRAKLRKLGHKGGTGKKKKIIKEEKEKVKKKKKGDSINTDELTGVEVREKILELSESGKDYTKDLKDISRKLDKLWFEKVTKIRDKFGYSSKEYKEIKREYDKLNRKKISIKAKIKSQSTDKIEALLKVKNKIKIKSNEVFWKQEFDREGKKIREGLDFIESIVDKRVLDKKLNIDFYAMYDGGRASYSPLLRQVKLTTHTGKSTVVHEVGHAVEEHSDRISRLMQRFRNARGANDPSGLRKLSEITGNSGYSSFEKAYKDKFIEPYMGKHYSNATEILSMGLEMLKTNPMKLIKNDPEYFDFIINAIRGHFDECEKVIEKLMEQSLKL